MIEGGRDRNAIARTTEEESELHRKMIKKQQENPDLDLTVLFDSERAE